MSHRRGNASMVTLQSRAPLSYAAISDVSDVPGFAVRETTPAGPPRLMAILLYGAGRRFLRLWTNTTWRPRSMPGERIFSNGLGARSRRVTGTETMRLLAAGLAILVASPAFGQVVLDAKPTVKVESDEGGTSRFVLSEPDRTKYRITIIRRGGRYFWTSREDRELVHSASGAFPTSSSPVGAVTSKCSTRTYCRNPCGTPGRGFATWSTSRCGWARSLTGAQPRSFVSMRMGPLTSGRS